MRLLVFVLNKTENLEALLPALLQAGISGATICRAPVSQGSVQSRRQRYPFLGSIRTLLNPKGQKSNTLLIVIQDEQLGIAVETIEKVVGSICNKDTELFSACRSTLQRGCRAVNYEIT
jgi:hypothetical protein